MDTEGWTLAVILWEKLDSVLGHGQLHRSAKTVRAIKTSLQNFTGTVVYMMQYTQASTQRLLTE
jgi:hypothetical protein